MRFECDRSTYILDTSAVGSTFVILLTHDTNPGVENLNRERPRVSYWLLDAEQNEHTYHEQAITVQLACHHNEDQEQKRVATRVVQNERDNVRRSAYEASLDRKPDETGHDACNASCDDHFLGLPKVVYHTACNRRVGENSNGKPCLSYHKHDLSQIKKVLRNTPCTRFAGVPCLTLRVQ